MFKKTNVFKNANVRLLIISAIVTPMVVLLWSPLSSLFLPSSILELLEGSQSTFLFFYCFYSLVGCYIGIKTKNYIDALIKSICVGLGFYFTILILGVLYASILILLLAPWFFIYALPCMAAIVIPALLAHFLRSRVKLNKYALFSILSVIIILAYIPLSGAYADMQKDTPVEDYMRATPAYKGVKQQIVEDSQFQLERDLTPDREDYYIGFGSFPAIESGRESSIMVSEFCHQHLDL